MSVFTRFKIDKHGRSMYRLNGSKNSTVRLGANFFKGAPPEMIEVDAENLETHTGPRAKLSKEERAALPKPSVAEKIAAAEARLAKMKVKLAATTPVASAPTGDAATM